MICYFKTKEKIGAWGKGCTVSLKCDVSGTPLDPAWRDHFYSLRIVPIETKGRQ